MDRLEYLRLLLPLLLPLFTIAMLFTVLSFYTKYGEIFRPFIGKLLFRSPKLRRNLDVADLFRVGNHGNSINTVWELNYANERIQKYIKKTSWFRRHDLRLLQRYYDSYVSQIEYLEAYERNKKFGKKSKANPQISRWREVLGLSQTEKDPKIIKKAYRVRVAKDHPDKGGTGKKMPDLNKALDAAREELNFV